MKFYCGISLCEKNKLQIGAISELVYQPKQTRLLNFTQKITQN